MADRLTAPIAGAPALNRHPPPGDARFHAFGKLADTNHDLGI